MKRTFILGDEWLYYKLYCGKRTADMVLVDSIKPLTEALLEKKLIDKWFFIRYTDPNPHLRIRFHFNDINKLGFIINHINKAISNYVKNDLIWKVQADTYTREIERYGENTIEETEHFFFIDSNTCLKSLDLIKDDTVLFMFALRSINTLFEVFDFNTKTKLSFVKENLEAFKAEFNANKNLNKQLYKKHNGLKKEIITFLEMQNHIEYQPLINLLHTKKKELETLKKMICKKNTQDNINHLLSNYIHMTINRMFRDQQRLHELVCYDNLYRFYNFIINQKKHC
ncbi:thiopeptide-type bacteriocin biosynthesis protein [Tenacibaculum ovolyticum]|uniref:thiopeptide-type bacteriocin biosynthesis protein n=1 Tax=Tenacibaculum ovolyticum TaxID=104270 RepID=UPI00041102CE|nr:thiopeptide-type bacteriocin biosynthesis protein [Tenacibaculum ovolyticum]